ncbi:MAG: alpha/beta fold hydrolase [Pseudonocardia sp.]|nr:alpha/beta fold hydrolase [Pseudonocardia sp.]
MTTPDGARLCVETFGDPRDRAVLLVGGAASSMDYWEDGFCAQLAAGGRHVIRFDARDTGRSTTWPIGEPGYTGADLAADPIVVLDGLGVERAHLVGISMGASIVASLASRHPERVLTLTIASGSPGGDDLPPPSADVAPSFVEPPPEIDWSDRAAVAGRLVDDLRGFTGSLPFDEDHARSVVARVLAHSPAPAAANNHWLVVGGDSDEQATDLAAIAAPTLVWHGSADPLFPLPHGEAFRDRIPNARLVVLEGVGHEYPPPSTWEIVVSELLAHTTDPHARQ